MKKYLTNKTTIFILSATALVVSYLLLQFQLNSVEFTSYDLRFKIRSLVSRGSQSNNIATITFDSFSLEKLGKVPTASDHAKIISNINKAAPAAIVYLFSPPKLKDVDKDNQQNQIIVRNEKENDELAKVTKVTSNLFFSIPEIKIKGTEYKFTPAPPFSKVNVDSTIFTFDGKSFAQDGATRRLVLSYDKSYEQLSVKLASKFNHITDYQNYRGYFESLDVPQLFINFNSSHTYSPLKYADVLSNNFNPQDLQKKIVIVGSDTQTNLADYVKTPFSKDTIAMSKVELYANILDTLIQNKAIVRAPEWLDFVLTCIISLITVFAVWSLTPTLGLITIISTAATFSVIAFAAFAGFNFWIGMAHPLVGIFICYYFFIPYRLIKENRKSWEYQQKNKLLKQVDELKSNFINLMSHDLKTPLARIQGMVEVTTQDGANLTSQQKAALKTISNSTEELGVFITSVLNLSRIESKEIKLHLEGKDINTVVQEIIQKYKFLANEKNIEIVEELEPLFSIKVDPELIRQVISNLVENAIKYSPEGSKVLITTEEVAGKVSIQVSDQGKGIAKEEQAKIFDKFYRTSDAKNSPIKGSGMGLYLSKYFVELHKGSISVDSEQNQGSTFTVQIPNDLK